MASKLAESNLLIRIFCLKWILWQPKLQRDPMRLVKTCIRKQFCNILKIVQIEAHYHFNEDRPCNSKEHLESHEKQHVTPPSNEKQTGLPFLPVAEVKNKRQRKKLPPLIISSTPVKTALEAKEQEKMEEEREKRLRQLNKDEKK
ncbi:hypothetical protein JTB14_004868 [Gonioctena quinquepunctata]|nr:hypothetical protein JTB14_004868 [Gonioctena quinquepunctata]